MANLKEELHTDSQELLDKTFEVLRLKMISNQEKYGWSNEWLIRDWEDECRKEMIKHIHKGDPRDVAIYALFMIYRGWSTKDEHQKDNLKQVDDKEWIAQLEAMLKSRTQEVKELKEKIANLPKNQVIKPIPKTFTVSKSDYEWLQINRPTHLPNSKS